MKMQVHISRLEAQTIIGIHDWEKQQKQTLFISVDMTVDAADAIESDAIGDAVDYDATSTLLLEYLASAKTQLIEKLAAELLDIIMKNPRVQEAELLLEKPDAVAAAESIAVSCTATRVE